MSKTINIEKGYPFTPEEFSEFLHSNDETSYKCTKLYILKEEVEEFKKACHRSIVRYIPVRDFHKEKEKKDHIDFFVVYIMEGDLFRLGRILGKSLKE
ncbi:hypothetical protein [Tenacibaculum singaporense]|uniref:hypothetical protein n=1 Tax=Tenacibaculum singaporense TaxID=2358479 RepID=UPI000F6652E6|nr:hypothetical protein [Tenacibaculum singaporense]RSC96036.1 hypothetical protein EI424_02645 [Tenacibaculum singaporense]